MLNDLESEANGLSLFHLIAINAANIITMLWIQPPTYYHLLSSNDYANCKVNKDRVTEGISSSVLL